MPKMIQVRNVPDRLHRELTRRARERRQSLTDYVEEILEREVDRPIPKDLMREIAQEEPIVLDRPISDLIAEEREERDSRWLR